MDGESTQTLELSEAQTAYQMALARLEEALPKIGKPPVVVDPTTISWPRLLLRALVAIPRALLRLIGLIFGQAGEGLTGMLHDLKARLAGFAQGGPVVMGGPEVERRNNIRSLLLETLWARDHVQDAIERRDGASYVSKRDTLTFVMDNEVRLQRVGQLALEAADLDTSDLREVQPTPPGPERWWWFLNYPRAKRARRLNTVWFVLALLPAMASVVLITLLAQRLAINGPDLLSSASVIAQVGLGLASIIAGREILNDLILRGVTSSWQGKLSFALASLFLSVVVIFYFVAPPGAAMIYHAFGQRAIDAGNAAEAELYLESAARLDPDPHAASLLEVGCLYQALGAPERAQTVFERVLEADSRLLLARYHLAQLYTDRGEYDQSLQLLEDGLNLLDTGRSDMARGDYEFLPGVNTEAKADEMEYLLRLARGRAYLESSAPEQAKTNLRNAEALFEQVEADSAAIQASANALGRFDLSCGPKDDRRPFILNTRLDLHYYLARTYDALCSDDATIVAAQEEWRLIRNGQPSSSRQEAWRDEAVRRLSSDETCTTNYGLTAASLLGSLGEAPSRR
jgi:tetratricopeptide (TPR) repeat protein